MSVKSLITTFFLFSFSFISLAADSDDLELDSELGSFYVDAGDGREGNKIEVFYYKPKTFDENSNIVMVLSDRDRNSEMARNRWIAAAKKYNLFILSPMYTSDVYPTSANYDLAGTLTVIEDEYVPIEDRSQWIFEDFDRVFDIAVEATQSNQTGYDFFGHGSSGELAHRLALFYPQTKANRIVAANASWYTVPDFSSPFPYGLKRAPIQPEPMISQLPLSFSKKLIVLLGENDNEDEFRGWFRRDKFADLQGTHRLERGRYFYEQSELQANTLNTSFAWDIQLVPSVGHSPTRMSIAAADVLFGGS
jgi:pimeloyl-ACP methyl ester carboxylesterase